jgi:membrane fusion protein, multidrug efflux system
VYTLARAGEREVVFDLPEHALAALPETLDVRAWADPGAALPARVREVSPQADPASRTYRVRATLGDAGAALPLGASASVTYLPRGSAPALGVPLAALLRTPAGGAAVWVVGTDGRVDRRAVALGPAHGEEAAIVSGLAPGEWVVTAGAHDLHAGERVVPQ